MMPNIDGFELIHLLRLRYNTPSIPIVIITGFPDSQMLDNILKLGPVTVLKKPLKVETLQKTMQMLGHKVNEKIKSA